MQDQIKKLQSEIKQIGAPKKQIPVVKKIEKTSVAKLTEEYLSSGKAVRAYRKDIKGDVVARLKGFTSQLRESEQSKKNNLKKQTKIENDWECPLHFIKNCSSCRDTFGETVEEDDEDWMNATLQFPKQVGANVFEPKIDDYTVVDPRQGYYFVHLVLKQIHLVEIYKYWVIYKPDKRQFGPRNQLER
jgi:peptidyl-prolyl cis-trans isomerase SDCCAG10